MNKVLAIVGPTASGKTKLAVDIAEKYNGEVISADSRQVYKNIPVATAQPTEEDIKKVRHHFIGEIELTEEFNAGEFGIRGRKVIEEIFCRGMLPVISGGSGLYISSLIDGLFENNSKSKELRDELYKEYENKGEKYIYEKLRKADRETFEKIPPGKIRRVIRALEVFQLTGKKMSELQSEKSDIGFTTVQIGLMHERKSLYERINRRTDQMIENGLLEEVKRLFDSGMHYKKNYSLDTVGVKEVMKFLEGEYDFEKMKELIKQNSRRYAKRQMTWFRRDSRIKWINTEELSDEEIVKVTMKIFRETSGV
ncbi:MAG: tRNA (adenosine(37)-N6)-dimethylallyltransferase MiaA [Bacteroidetes bacterium]|nr:tRNA (adenosine(37)-N6)-dimethylallyltransferase MiaA [Bacteroidota bacterium]